MGFFSVKVEFFAFCGLKVEEITGEGSEAVKDMRKKDIAVEGSGSGENASSSLGEKKSSDWSYGVGSQGPFKAVNIMYILQCLFYLFIYFWISWYDILFYWSQGVGSQRRPKTVIIMYVL